MCGIAGYLQTGVHPDDWRRTLSAMANLLRHRGPDDEGLWFDAEAGVGIAHRRLAILDLSSRGRQPMRSSNQRYVLASNGEIYNFRSLRTELAERGHRFVSQTDTEVMLAAFLEWGVEGALERFDGMFAFALWDAQERRLHLVRDRMGEKPLYFGRLGTAVVFSSELGALAGHPEPTPPIDGEALVLYLGLGCVPAPHTILEQIQKLPPGSLVTLEARRPLPLPAARSYWDLKRLAEMGSNEPLRLDDRELIDLFEDELGRAVRSRMVSDTPVGAFLSGGVDSATITAMMQAASPAPVPTFTIGFAEKEHDEASWARRVAAHLGSRHTELRLGAAAALDVAHRLGELYDEPFADSSQIPTVLVSELARREVKVSLTGDGGDEIFCGYPRYRLARNLWRAFGWMPACARRGISRLVEGLPNAFFAPPIPGLERLARRVAKPWPGARKRRLFAYSVAADSYEELCRRVVLHWQPTPAVGRSGGPPHRMSKARSPACDLLQWAQATDLTGYLPDDLLVKVDRAAMAVGLETRLPMLAPDLVRLALRLPSRLRVRNGVGKWVLREVTKRHLPNELVNRPKQGFTIPLADWLRGPWREWAEALLEPERLRRQGILEPGPIQTRWRAHLAGSDDHSRELWDILALELWLANNPLGQRSSS